MVVVTVNMWRSYLPHGHAHLTPFSTLTLLRLDPGTGVLTPIGEYPYEGILPEAVVFDTSGRFLAVATYDHFDSAWPGGSIDFWRVVSDPLDSGSTFLVQTPHRISVTRGPHVLALIP